VDRLQHVDADVYHYHRVVSDGRPDLLIDLMMVVNLNIIVD